MFFPDPDVITVDPAFARGTIFILGLAWLGALSGLLATLVFAAGVCVSGVQIGLSAFASRLRPPPAPPTSTGRWASAASAAASARLSAALLGLGWGFGAILGILAIPALCAAIAIASTRPSAGSFPREAAAHPHAASTKIGRYFTVEKTLMDPARSAERPSLTRRGLLLGRCPQRNHAPALAAQTPAVSTVEFDVHIFLLPWRSRRGCPRLSAGPPTALRELER